MTDAPQIPREEAEKLLVFLANDTLEGDERTAVEAAIAEDDELRREYWALKNIRGQMQSEEIGRTPGEFGLARLMRDIDGETQAPATPIQQPVQGGVWRIAAAAVFTLFVAQTAFVWTSPDTVVELAGGGAGVASGPTLTVAFQPDAGEGAIRALLLAQGLVIVDGPSALGLYTLAAEDHVARDAAMAALAGQSDIVESVEAGE